MKDDETVEYSSESEHEIFKEKEVKTRKVLLILSKNITMQFYIMKRGTLAKYQTAQQQNVL